MWSTDLASRMLNHLGQPWLPPSYEALTALVRSWIFAVPFHNLDLLTGTSPREFFAAADVCLRLRGGGCHVHAAGLMALLQTLGYDAVLMGADISGVGDHLTVKVAVDKQLYWCDVGNGQPYLIPFRTNAVTTCSHLGWDVCASPVGNGMALSRKNSLQPQWRQVYVTSLRTYTWDDFSVAIDRHHSEPGFGPFLTGLRVTKIGESVMTTIRDRTITVWRPDGAEQFHGCSNEQLAENIARMVGCSDGVFRALGLWSKMEQKWGEQRR